MGWDRPWEAWPQHKLSMDFRAQQLGPLVNDTLWSAGLVLMVTTQRMGPVRFLPALRPSDLSNMCPRRKLACVESCVGRGGGVGFPWEAVILGIRVSSANTRTRGAVQSPGRTNFDCCLVLKQCFLPNFYPGPWLSATLPKVSEDF